MTKLDLNFVRDQFPAFSEKELEGTSFMENAGGSYMCKQVMDRLEDYFRTCKLQPYHPSPAAQKAGHMMDEAYESLAPWLNVGTDEIFFGPSTSQNTYVLAQAVLGWLQDGDEIIVTNQDHEANSGSWRKLADRGITVREWKVDPATGSLNLATLKSLITEKTKLIIYPHCSNIVAEINPLKEISKIAKDHNIRTIVDGVSFCGHGLPDMQDLGADIYLFSLYKVYGPHQGVMVIRKDMQDKLTPQNHFFLSDIREKKFMPSGPDHAQIAAVKGVGDYFQATCNHHFKDESDLPHQLHKLFQDAENEVMSDLITFIEDHPKLTLVGPSDITKRAPTISVTIQEKNPADVAQQLGDMGIMCGAGHFYSYRLLEAMGIDVDTGVLRFSMVHYNSKEDVIATIDALKKVL